MKMGWECFIQNKEKISCDLKKVGKPVSEDEDGKLSRYGGMLEKMPVDKRWGVFFME